MLGHGTQWWQVQDFAGLLNSNESDRRIPARNGWRRQTAALTIKGDRYAGMVDEAGLRAKDADESTQQDSLLQTRTL